MKKNILYTVFVVVTFLLSNSVNARPSLADLQEQIDALENSSDGVILINQEKALEGNVTPGDEPGFPIFISEPGSYRLSGNLSVLPATDGTVIIIGVDGVSIDLNGFALIGPSGSGSPTGIRGRGQVTIKNGTIRGMLIGIDVDDSAHINNIQVIDNFFSGIRVGANSLVSNCVVRYFGVVGGIKAGEGSIVKGNTVFDDRNATGISASGGSLVADNTVSNCSTGVLAGRGGAVLNNIFNENGTAIRFGDIGAKTAFSRNVIPGNQFIQGSQFLDLGDNVCGDDLICP